MKVIIAGTRTFNDYDLLHTMCSFYLLSNYHPDSIEIVSGGAKGADTLGERFAKSHGLEVKKFPADWEKHKRGAGFIRNRQMAEYADAAIIFWDGKSKGTKMMIDLAKEYKLKLRICYYNSVVA